MGATAGHRARRGEVLARAAFVAHRREPRPAPLTHPPPCTQGPIHHEWFKGGRTNLAFNCLDRHVAAGHGDQPCLLFEGNDIGREKQVGARGGSVAGRDGGGLGARAFLRARPRCLHTPSPSLTTQNRAAASPTRMQMSYREVLEEVCRLANWLRAQGVKKGDAVAIYLPMACEVSVCVRVRVCRGGGLAAGAASAAAPGRWVAGRAHRCTCPAPTPRSAPPPPPPPPASHCHAGMRAHRRRAQRGVWRV